MSTYHRYRHDIAGFSRDILKVTLWDTQLKALASPGRTLVESGHGVGKTFGAAVKVVHRYYTRARCVAITTAPTKRDVVDLLWNEIRLLVRRGNLPDHFVGPSAPEMKDPNDPEEHWAKGYTARDGESFQGRHRESMLFVFDEAEGVDGTYWTTTNTMYKPGEDHEWLAICNPTTSTSQRYQERRMIDLNGERKWNVMQFSCLDHPNIGIGFANRGRKERGEPLVQLPYPNAVTVEQVDGWIGEWFEPIAADEVTELDVEYPPGSGKWYRPDADGEARVLGRTPSAGTRGVWSEALWNLATTAWLGKALLLDNGVNPEIGCDVARFGDDRTEIHVRCGPHSLHHEDHGGWDTVKTAARLMELADEWAAWRTRLLPVGVKPVTGKSLRIKVDDTGVGGGVTDILVSHEYGAVPVNAGERAPDDKRYQRVRDQLWFDTAAMAKAGRLDLSRMGAKRLAKLEAQAMAPEKILLPDRRWKVEAKEDTKKKVGRSPDGMDAVNLAFYEAGIVGVAEWIETPGDGHRSWRDRPGGRQ